MVDWLKKVEKQERRFTDLFARMDMDKELLIQKPYTMFDKDGRSQPDVENLTLNDAATFAKTVTSNLNGAGMQTAVKGEELENKEAPFIESFLKDFTSAIDNLLYPRDIPTLMSWNVDQMCYRGRTAGRITLREEDGKLAEDIFLPMDTRYLVYEHGMEGLKWFAYKTPRSAEKIWDKYKVDIGKTSAIVTDIWDDEKEIVFIDKNQEKEEEHNFGEPPAIIQVAPTGLMFMDDDRILQSGESIFALDRNLYPEKHFFGSILKTITVMSFMGGLQKEVKSLVGAKKPEIPPFGKRFVVPVEQGTKGYFSMPIVDVRNSARLFYEIISKALQDGSLPNISLGSLEWPLSGSAMAILKEAEDPVYLPRLQGLALYYQRLYRMILDQYIKQQMHLKLGELGFQQDYPYQKLDKDFSISFSFFMTSPKQNMANISSAAAVGDLVSDDTKRRDYLQLKDPDGEEAKKWAEKAPRVSGAVAKFKIIEGLFKRDQIVEANLMAQELGFEIDRLMSGQLPEQIPENIEVKPKQLMPMFTEGSGVKPPGEEEDAQES